MLRAVSWWHREWKEPWGAVACHTPVTRAAFMYRATLPCLCHSWVAALRPLGLPTGREEQGRARCSGQELLL